MAREVLREMARNDGSGDADAVLFKGFAAAPKAVGHAARASREAEPQWTSMGGINNPRVLWCEGEDGRLYKQLVKGRDDLRGDAIMQQVFGLVNYLLTRDTSTRQRNLGMRTYRVVPPRPAAPAQPTSPSAAQRGPAKSATAASNA